ncbi:hypothetical protein AB1K99_21840, partial [Lederbergia ruris]
KIQKQAEKNVSFFSACLIRGTYWTAPFLTKTFNENSKNIFINFTECDIFILVKRFRLFR